MPVLDRATGRLCSLDIDLHWFNNSCVRYFIHKSQGKSLDNIIIDPNDWMYGKTKLMLHCQEPSHIKLWFKSKINPSDIKYDQYILDRMSTQRDKILLNT